MLEQKQQKEREQASTRTFFRKNNGCQNQPVKKEGAQKITKFFGVKPVSDTIELGFSDDESQADDSSKATPQSFDPKSLVKS